MIIGFITLFHIPEVPTKTIYLTLLTQRRKFLLVSVEESKLIKKIISQINVGSLIFFMFAYPLIISLSKLVIFITLI